MSFWLGFVVYMCKQKNSLRVKSGNMKYFLPAEKVVS